MERISQKAGECITFGLSSETKPSPEISNGQGFLEVDTGQFYLCNGAAWNLTVGPAVIVTSTTPARVFGTAFQPNATRASFCSYSAKIACVAAIGGGAQEGKIELLSDAANPPTTVRATMANRLSLALALTLSVTDEKTMPLYYLVPAGHYVKLVTTQVVGTPTFTLITQVEESLG